MLVASRSLSHHRVIVVICNVFRTSLGFCLNNDRPWVSGRHPGHAGILHLPHYNSEFNSCAFLFYYCSRIAQGSLLGRDVMLCLLMLADGLVSASYGSIYPAVQNLLLAARAAGLGAALITLPLWSTWLVGRVLGLPWRVAACAIVPLV